MLFPVDRVEHSPYVPATFKAASGLKKVRYAAGRDPAEAG